MQTDRCSIPNTLPPGAIFDVVHGEVVIDFETCSATDLKRAGAWCYSTCPSTIVWVMSWCYVYDGAPSPGYRWTPADPAPAALVAFVRAGGRLVAHNAAFERAIWANVLVKRLGWPAMALEQWVDTMPLSCAMGLPRKLEGVAAALGLPVQKDMEGATLMRKLAKAEWRDDGSVDYPQPTPEQLARLYAYCDDDVRVTALLRARPGGAAKRKLDDLSPFEARVLALDQRINVRGVHLDERYAQKLHTMATERRKNLNPVMRRLTDAELHDAGASAKLKDWLVREGVELPLVRRKLKGGWAQTPSADKAALAKLLEEGDISEKVRAVLTVRQEATRAVSLAKLTRVPEMVDSRGRLRDAIAYCGATATGRWASYGLQLHNLRKSSLADEEAALAELAIEREDVGLLELTSARPLDVLSQKLRGVLVAAPGHELIGADYSAIEACVCSWLAGQDDKVQFLHEFFREKARWRRGERPDKPQDLYEFAAAGMGSDSRQLGKVAELALQYGMGDKKFHTTGRNAGIAWELAEAGRIKRAWRRSNPMIVRFWAELQGAALAAVQEPGQPMDVGRIRALCGRSRLFLVLPSGRALSYWAPRVDVREKEVEYVNDEGVLVKTTIKGPELSYLVPTLDHSGVERETTYGGKLVENVTQAVARDVLAEGLLQVDAAGYPIVVHVHDAMAAEVPAGTGDVDEFCRLMLPTAPWAEGLPCAAEGYRSRRFKG